MLGRSVSRDIWNPSSKTRLGLTRVCVQMSKHTLSHHGCFFLLKKILFRPVSFDVSLSGEVLLSLLVTNYSSLAVTGAHKFFLNFWACISHHRNQGLLGCQPLLWPQHTCWAEKSWLSSGFFFLRASWFDVYSFHVFNSSPWELKNLLEKKDSEERCLCESAAAAVVRALMNDVTPRAGSATEVWPHPFNGPSQGIRRKCGDGTSENVTCHYVNRDRPWSCLCGSIARAMKRQL